jgi:hypothetical protein
MVVTSRNILLKRVVFVVAESVATTPYLNLFGAVMTRKV